MEKRRYGMSPDVCILLGKIELALGDDRIKYAGKILMELKKQGIILFRISLMQN